MAVKKATASTTRKKAGSRTTASSLPTPTHWYRTADKEAPPPREGFLYLIITEDVEGDVFLQVGKWDSVLSVWLNTDDVAVEAVEHVGAYSLVYDPAGKPWVVG